MREAVKPTADLSLDLDNMWSYMKTHGNPDWQSHPSYLDHLIPRVLERLGSIHCMVVHGEDGLDEISLSGRTRVSELKDGNIRTYDLDPEQYGFECRPLDAIAGGEPETNARIALDVLEGQPGPRREIVLLNAGAAIYVGGQAPDLDSGIALARDSIDSRRALAKLTAMRESAARSHA